MTKTDVHPAIGVMALRRITFAEAGRATGYHPEYISKVLRGCYPLTSKFCSRFAAYLGEPEDRLFRREVVSR